MENSKIIEIISDVKSGEAQAFAKLVNEYKHMVYSLCLKMTNSVQDSEEICQDAFVKAYTSINTFKGQSKFSTWLYQIAYFTTINYLRKNKIKTTTKFNHTLIDSNESVLDDLQNQERMYFINKAFEFLKPNERVIITLYFLEEQSLKEIAEITKLSISNVKVILHRTKKKLYGIIKILLKDEVKSLI